MASSDPFWGTAFECLCYVAHLCSLMETFILSSLRRPTFTGFRMFPPPDLQPAYPMREIHVGSLLCLPCIPWMVYWERRPVPYTGPGQIGRLMSPLTRSNRYAACAIMLARVWTAAAFWNIALSQYLMDLDYVSFGTKVGALIFLI
ncbi:hypothetical protein F4825DRAFT_450227 [Nemania diffusa]|nr:hypothetical protein F4825DRAFT_450227 [Nemania diffusa]